MAKPKRTYSEAVNLAIEETNLPDARFSTSSPWTFEQAMDQDFLLAAVATVPDKLVKNQRS
jgi:hypothetical protein